MILRRVSAVDGDTRVRMVLDARAGFGHHSMRAFSEHDGVLTGRTGGLHLRLSGATATSRRSDGVPDISGTIADRDARHAYAVLQGMTSAVGGMVAGMTMSLPERVEHGRDYDYRYA